MFSENQPRLRRLVPFSRVRRTRRGIGGQRAAVVVLNTRLNIDDSGLTALSVSLVLLFPRTHGSLPVLHPVLAHHPAPRLVECPEAGGIDAVAALNAVSLH